MKRRGKYVIVRVEEYYSSQLVGVVVSLRKETDYLTTVPLGFYWSTVDIEIQITLGFTRGTISTHMGVGWGGTFGLGDEEVSNINNAIFRV